MCTPILYFVIVLLDVTKQDYLIFFFCHCCPITKTCLFKYTENFTPKNENFRIINSDIFIFLLKT